MLRKKEKKRLKVKYKEISLVFQEDSSEIKKQAQELKDFCRKKGYQCNIIDFGQALGGGSSIRITMEDNFLSEEMKAIIEICQQQKWKKGEEISKNSRNILEAYKKADKEYKKTPEKIGEFREYLRSRIIKRVIEAYNQTEEKEK